MRGKKFAKTKKDGIFALHFFNNTNAHHGSCVLHLRPLFSLCRTGKARHNKPVPMSHDPLQNPIFSLESGIFLCRRRLSPFLPSRQGVVLKKYPERFKTAPGQTATQSFASLWQKPPTGIPLLTHAIHNTTNMELNLTELRLTNPTEAAKRPIVIAGPCAAETEEQVFTTATQLAQKGIHIFRAGLWKPRTKPGGFEGIGEKGLEWLNRVQKELGMKVCTEVATQAHAEAALHAGIDALWIGARTVANPFAMQEIADALRGSDIPVLVKNPVNPDLELWIGGLERINQAGITRLAVIHRGFSTYEKRLYRNLPMWHIPIELRRRIPGLPVFGDPSHIGGKRELIAPLCQQAMDLGFEGLIVESHCNPDAAWSDARQQVTPDVLHFILEKLIVRKTANSTEELDLLRHRIDEIDNALIELLAKRMCISREIGRYKRECEMTAVQTNRYTEILYKRGAQGVLCGMSADFIKSVFENIHEESVRQQIDIMNKD